MDYHLLTKKCDGMCDSCECPPATLPDRPPTPGCRTPEGCRENGCLGWCDEHRPEASAGVEDLQREVARLKVENARLAEETMRLQRLLNAAHQIVGELARPSGI